MRYSNLNMKLEIAPEPNTFQGQQRGWWRHFVVSKFRHATVPVLTIHRLADAGKKSSMSRRAASAAPAFESPPRDVIRFLL
jgi:hypothetical protein